MGLADGDLYVSGSILSYQQANRMYQNFRGASVPSALKAGALWSKSSDDRLYHQGVTLDEVFTEKTSLTFENLLSNSGFGVWSQSDAAQGVATMAYDAGAKGAGAAPSVGDAAVGGTSGATAKIKSYTIASGAFATNDAAGILILGACTGRFIDNETVTFAGVETCVVNQPIGSPGVDLIQNGEVDADSGWTKSGTCTIINVGGGDFEIVFTNSAVALNCYQNAPGFVVGKIYLMTITCSNYTDGSYSIYTDSGVSQIYADAATHTFAFEANATTQTVGIRAETALTNARFDDISCYEITGCGTGAGALCFDGANKDGTLHLYRQYNDASLTKDGEFFSLEFVPTTAGDALYLTQGDHAKTEFYSKFLGQPVTLGCWVLANTASHAYLRLYDTAYTSSSFHTGGGDWEWLEVTTTVDVAATEIEGFLSSAIAPNVDGSTIIYFSQVMMVLGSHIGEGNYAPKPRDFMNLKAYVPSALTVGNYNISTRAYATLNVEADSLARLPKGCKAVYLYSDVRDAASAAASASFVTRANSTTGQEYVNGVSGVANDQWQSKSGRQACDSGGDIQYSVNATGANTFDIGDVRYVGVQLN